jgi:hypothetical protein
VPSVWVDCLFRNNKSPLHRGHFRGLTTVGSGELVNDRG